ncbi:MULTISPECIES: ABC transporter substrate-binding protein [unclassified Leifsonia]|uniref:ABC transporter substrate-binding protein n=1 Tax=unclassified Leifsonia TaxID=2663824 RepID=UPI0006F9E53E|nr:MULTISPECIES: ABC transporter substrate-binding protein [unclassified Leifsonia]KQX07159.1 spermidine/putrescine ABC transporter substrate-binding protein [Leifsonia sp. Root1293]KRA11442.1 spermidine/putrescine ABC transporter substrate-binding protein [Leifsonia sp. Root60]
MKRTTARTSRAVMSGVALVSATFLLTACGTSSGGGTTAEAPTKLGDTEGAVSILAWPGYVEDGSNDPEVDWVSAFEEQTGCMVTSKTYGTSDEAFSLMKTGDYDVVAASGDASLRLVAADTVAPVNTDLIENYDGIYDFLKDQSWNSVDGVSYGIPHGYGANLLMYNTEEVTPAPTSWDVVFDESSPYKGKVTAYDSPIYIADAAVYLMAHEPDLGIENPYALDEKQLAAAVDLLKEQRVNVGEYWSDYLKEIQAFETGDTVVGTTWQVIKNSLAADTPAEVVLPDEGTTGWSDTWMIASKAKNPNCAYAWLDYIASPEANAQATEYFGEAPSNQAACEFRSEGSCEAFHAGDEEYASKIWYWSTPIEKCLDGRTDVTCTDYAAWTSAWQEIKG